MAEESSLQEVDQSTFIERPDFILEDIRIIKTSLSKLSEKSTWPQIAPQLPQIFIDHYTENLEASIALERALKSLEVDRNEMEEKCDEATVEVIMSNFDAPVFAKRDLTTIIQYHNRDAKIQDDKLDNSFFRTCLYRLLNCNKSNFQCEKLLVAAKRIVNSPNYRPELIDVPSCWGSFDVLLDLFLHLMLPLIFHNPGLDVSELLKTLYSKKATDAINENNSKGANSNRKRGRPSAIVANSSAQKAKKRFFALDPETLRETEREELEEKRKKLLDMCTQAEYVYLLAQIVLVSLKRILVKREQIIIRLSREMETAALRKSHNALVYSVEFTENICDYPIAANAMKRIARCQQLDSDSVHQLYRSFAASNPPPSDLLLLPTIPELLADAIFSPVDIEHVNPDEHEKLVFLYAYAASKRDVMRDDKRMDIANHGFSKVLEQVASASSVCHRWIKLSMSATVFNMRDYHDLPLLLEHISSNAAVAYGVLRFVCVILGCLLQHNPTSLQTHLSSTASSSSLVRSPLLPDGLHTHSGNLLQKDNSNHILHQKNTEDFSDEEDIETDCQLIVGSHDVVNHDCIDGGIGLDAAHSNAFTFTEESFQPYKVLLADIITHYPCLRPYIRAILARLLSEHQLSGIEDLNQVEFQRSLIDLVIHLMISGDMFPVLNMMKKLYFKLKMDVSLARYFVTELLSLVSKPYKSEFVEALNPFVQNQEIINGAKTNRIDYENIREFIEFYQQVKKLRRATRK